MYINRHFCIPTFFKHTHTHLLPQRVDEKLVNKFSLPYNFIIMPKNPCICTMYDKNYDVRIYQNCIFNIISFFTSSFYAYIIVYLWLYLYIPLNFIKNSIMHTCSHSLMMMSCRYL